LKSTQSGIPDADGIPEASATHSLTQELESEAPGTPHDWLSLSHTPHDKQEFENKVIKIIISKLLSQSPPIPQLSCKLCLYAMHAILGTAGVRKIILPISACTKIISTGQVPWNWHHQ
jgi:hypothetical protein